MTKGNMVCPAACSAGLDNIFRRWVHNPDKILKSYIKEGMTVLDVGCGPGTFTLALAEMAGRGGKVIAADLQAGMLAKLKEKIAGSGFENRIHPHQCESDRIGVLEKVDFVLAFWMVHEVADQAAFFREIKSILKPDGRMLVVEPKIHVSKNEFEQTLVIAEQAGLKASKAEKVFFSRAVILESVDRSLGGQQDNP